MGIPSFFRTIIKEYPNTHFGLNHGLSVDHFFIDFNAMIYNVIYLLKDDEIKGLNTCEIEKIIIENTISHLHHVICEVIKPQKSVYIAIDGPPPMAKMIQQRYRRYKSVSESQFKNGLRKKYPKAKIPYKKWNTSAISPGTIFMDKLSNNIIRSIKAKRFGELKIIFSDYSVPGEGEHKLMPIVKEVPDNETSVIYSPDADLIVLAVMCQKPNIFILREPKDSDIEKKVYKGQEFLYLSIDKCREGFMLELRTKYDIELDSEAAKNFLLDYSFLTFFCGNDFVVSPYYLKIKGGGMDILMEIYNQIFNDSQKHLIIKDELNFDFFTKIVYQLSLLETKHLQKWQKSRDRTRKGNRSKAKLTKEAGMEDWEKEFARFQHEEYYSPAHPKYETHNHVFDNINYFDDNWIDKYNSFFFGDNVNIKRVCTEYVKSLLFCLKYYISGTPSWTWYYRYRASPSFKDLYSVLTGSGLSNLSFRLGNPMQPFQQLMFILPKHSFKLLPKSISTIDQNMLPYYPSTFKLDIVHGTKYIYSEPILPKINLMVIKDKIDQAKFTPIETKRNTLKKEPFIWGF